VKLKKKIRKRLMKPVRKLVKRHGAVIAAEIVGTLIAAAATRATKDKKQRREGGD
jgi:hypothetical protein